MPYARTIVLTSFAMLAFAGNSVLCRLALSHTSIDEASFTTVRLISGAFMLWLIVKMRGGTYAGNGNWLSAFALFAYAAALSFAYVGLSTATGALLLFGAVQATMIGYGLFTGERLRKVQVAGITLALIGLVILLLPGITAPPILASALMVGSGVAWGIYSLRGKAAGDPTKITSGNFTRAAVISVVFSLILAGGSSFDSSFDSLGVWYAVASGALTSGVGYSIWYTVLPALKSTSAATVQLIVPVLAAVGGVMVMSEPITLRLVVASLGILGGIALVIVEKNSLSSALKAD